jgi:hypothetical protein
MAATIGRAEAAGAVDGLVTVAVGSDLLLQAATKIIAQRIKAARLSMAASSSFSPSLRSRSG